VALRYGRAKSRQDIALALACCTGDFVLETPPFGTRACGRAQVEEDLRVFFEQFPDYEFTTAGVAENGDSVVLWGRVGMTWSGRIPSDVAKWWERPLRLPRRRIEVPAVAVFEVSGGLLAREQFFFDMSEVTRQMGVPTAVVRSLLRRIEWGRHEVVEGAAVVRTEHSVVVDAPIDAAFARAFGDVERLMLANPPWPMLRAKRIELVGADVLSEGAIRRVHLSNGHVTDELIEECAAPRRVRYRVMNGWGMPIDAVIASTYGEHELEPMVDGRTLVTWRGFLVPRRPAAAPIVDLLAAAILGPVQRRYLRAIEKLFRETNH
jgi:hypothetical protein